MRNRKANLVDSDHFSLFSSTVVVVVAAGDMICDVDIFGRRYRQKSMLWVLQAYISYSYNKNVRDDVGGSGICFKFSFFPIIYKRLQDE